MLWLRYRWVAETWKKVSIVSCNLGFSCANQRMTKCDINFSGSVKYRIFVKFKKAAPNFTRSLTQTFPAYAKSGTHNYAIDVLFGRFGQILTDMLNNSWTVLSRKYISGFMFIIAYRLGILTSSLSNCLYICTFPSQSPSHDHILITNIVQDEEVI